MFKAIKMHLDLSVWLPLEALQTFFSPDSPPYIQCTDKTLLTCVVIWPLWLRSGDLLELLVGVISWALADQSLGCPLMLFDFYLLSIQSPSFDHSEGQFSQS